MLASLASSFSSLNFNFTVGKIIEKKSVKGVIWGSGQFSALSNFPFNLASAIVPFFRQVTLVVGIYSISQESHHHHYKSNLHHREANLSENSLELII